MKKSKVLGAVLGIGILLSSGVALAAPFSFSQDFRNCDDTATTTKTFNPYYTPGNNAILAFVGDNCDSGFYHVNIGSGIAINTGYMYVTPSTIETTDGYLINTLNIINSKFGMLSADINSLYVSMGAIQNLSITGFLGNNASTSPYIASTTKNGLMSINDRIALNRLTSPVAATSSRSVVTDTGASGWQVATTTGADVHYSVTSQITSTIAGASSATILLELAPTNSATSTDWVEIGRCTNGQAISLAIALQSVQTIGCQLNGYVPKGYFTKLRAVNSGTVTNTYNSGQEVLR